MKTETKVASPVKEEAQPSNGAGLIIFVVFIVVAIVAMKRKKKEGKLG